MSFVMFVPAVISLLCFELWALPLMFQAIALRLEAFALRLEVIALRLEAIASS